MGATGMNSVLQSSHCAQRQSVREEYVLKAKAAVE